LDGQAEAARSHNSVLWRAEVPHLIQLNISMYQ
jgi:hypothetical protein